MVKLQGECSVVIQAPAEAVYTYVSDLSRHTEWNYQPVQISKISDGPAGVGAVYRSQERPPRSMSWLMKRLFPLMSKLFGSAGYTEAEITLLEPNRRVVWQARAPRSNGELIARATWEVILEPQGRATRVTQSVEFEALGPAEKRVNVDDATAMIVDEMARNLAQLKAVLEAKSAPAAAADRPAFA